MRSQTRFTADSFHRAHAATILVERLDLKTPLDWLGALSLPKRLKAR
jgi:hypothetical protein